jgi:hypothetical protein
MKFTYSYLSPRRLYLVLICYAGHSAIFNMLARHNMMKEMGFPEVCGSHSSFILDESNIMLA